MRRRQHPVSVRIDDFRLCSRMIAPQGERQAVVPTVQFEDDPVGKLLPPFASMTACHVSPHSQHRIEQQHALTRPMSEAAVIGRFNAEIRFDLFENIS